MRRCDLCGVDVPTNAYLQHERGRRHASFRFYGPEGHGTIMVKDILVLHPTRYLRPHQVPRPFADCARRARELVIPHLVSLGGVDLFKSACAKFSPENMAGQLMSLQGLEAFQTGLRASHAAFDFPSAGSVSIPPDMVAVAVALVEENPFGGALRHVRLRLSDQPSASAFHNAAAHHAPGNLLPEITMAAALMALASAVSRSRPSRLDLDVDMGRAIEHRHRMAALCSRLAASLRSRSRFGALKLTLKMDSPAFRTSDADGLVAAAESAWWDRELTVLKGTHAGGESPLRHLPATLVRHILDLAVRRDRAWVRIHLSERCNDGELQEELTIASRGFPVDDPEAGSAMPMGGAAPPPASQAPPAALHAAAGPAAPTLGVAPPVPPAGAGADLDAIAAMLVD